MKKENEIVEKVDNFTKDFDESLVCLKMDVDEKHHRVLVKGEATPAFIAECIHELMKNNPGIVKALMLKAVEDSPLCKALDMMEDKDEDEDENSSEDEESDSLDELASTLKEVNSKLSKIMSKKTIH